MFDELKLHPAKHSLIEHTKVLYAAFMYIHDIVSLRFKNMKISQDDETYIHGNLKKNPCNFFIFAADAFMSKKSISTSPVAL